MVAGGEEASYLLAACNIFVWVSVKPGHIYYLNESEMNAYNSLLHPCIVSNVDPDILLDQDSKGLKEKKNPPTSISYRS